MWLQRSGENRVELRCKFQHDEMKMKLQRQHVKNEKGKKLKTEASETLTLRKRRKLHEDGEVAARQQLSGRSKTPNLRDRKRQFQVGENSLQCQMQVNQEQIDTTGLSSLK